ASVVEIGREWHGRAVGREHGYECTAFGWTRATRCGVREQWRGERKVAGVGVTGHGDLAEPKYGKRGRGLGARSAKLCRVDTFTRLGIEHRGEYSLPGGSLDALWKIGAIRRACDEHAVLG